jgi:DNA-binding NarL/FixJ family response regulator
MTRALLIEPQALFAPYFANVMARAGSQVTVTERAPKRFLKTREPNLIVLDATDRQAAPLKLVSGLRKSLPNARIVLFARNFEPIWASLASAVGADAVIDASATESEFIAALS